MMIIIMIIFIMIIIVITIIIILLLLLYVIIILNHDYYQYHIFIISISTTIVNCYYYYIGSQYEITRKPDRNTQNPCRKNPGRSRVDWDVRSLLDAEKLLGATIKPLFLAGETTIVYIYIRVNYYHSQIIRVN